MPKVTRPTPRINLKKKSIADKKGYLYLIFRYSGNKISYPIGEQLLSSAWDSNNGRINTKVVNRHDALKKKLRKLKDAAIHIYDSDHDIHPSKFKLELDYVSGKKERPLLNGSDRLTLMGFINSFIEEQKSKSNNKRGTWKKFITVSNILKQYSEEKGINLGYKDINWQFKSDFESWLYSEPRKYSVNNAAKIFEVIKQFMNVSLRRDHHNFTKHREEGFGVKRVKVQNKIRMNFQELQELINLDLSENPKQDKIRDLFIVGCYTGLRFSDWHKISEDSLIEEDGTKILEILTEKTKKLVMIPVLDELETVLEKYNYNIPKIVSQTFNEQIKLICKKVLKNKKFKRVYSEAGEVKEEKTLRWQFISSHCARRSFASNFWEMGIPANILMQITGHASEKQFFEYIDVDQKKQAERFKVLVAQHTNKRYLKKVK